MKNNEKILIELGKKKLRKELSDWLENINNLRFRGESINYNQVLGMYKEVYKAKLEEIKKLKVDVDDIMLQYNETIREYRLLK